MTALFIPFKLTLRQKDWCEGLSLQRGGESGTDAVCYTESRATKAHTATLGGHKLQNVKDVPYPKTLTRSSKKGCPPDKPKTTLCTQTPFTKKAVGQKPRYRQSSFGGPVLLPPTLFPTALLSPGEWQLSGSVHLP